MGGGVGLNLVDLAPQRVRSVVMLSAIGVQELELLGLYPINHAIHGAQLAGFFLRGPPDPAFRRDQGGRPFLRIRPQLLRQRPAAAARHPPPLRRADADPARPQRHDGALRGGPRAPARWCRKASCCPSTPTISCLIPSRRSWSARSPISSTGSAAARCATRATAAPERLAAAEKMEQIRRPQGQRADPPGLDGAAGAGHPGQRGSHLHRHRPPGGARLAGLPARRDRLRRRHLPRRPDALRAGPARPAADRKGLAAFPGLRPGARPQPPLPRPARRPADLRLAVHARHPAAGLRLGRPAWRCPSGASPSASSCRSPSGPRCWWASRWRVGEPFFDYFGRFEKVSAPLLRPGDRAGLAAHQPAALAAHLARPAPSLRRPAAQAALGVLAALGLLPARFSSTWSGWRSATAAPPCSPRPTRA